MIEKLRFGNEPVIVVGAGGGIGRACSQALAELDATVILVDRDAKTVHETEALIKNRSACQSFVVDVSQEEQIDDLRRTIADKWGRVKALINSAGANLMASIEETSTSQWREVIA